MSSTRRVTRPEKAPSSPDIVFRDIITGLYEGRYVPGQRLVEADLARQYNVSRSSLREALNRLAAEGIVALNLHRGACIRSLNRKEVEDVLALVELMIGLAGRLAATYIDARDHRARFKASLQQLMAFEKKPDLIESTRARNRFYRILVEIGGNTELGRVLPSMHVHLVRVQFRGFYAQVEAERFDDYRRIGEAVLSGDAQAAERACRAHVRRIAKGLEHLPETAFAPDR
jgi:DNA-binding GntR family transcriptional regulator